MSRGPGDDGNLKGATGKRFVRGATGNPRGIPRATIEMRRVIPAMIADLSHGGADLVFMLFRIAAGAEPGLEDAKSRCWAVRELLDRSIGRPAMSLVVTPGSTDAPGSDDKDPELSVEEMRVLSKVGLGPRAKVLQLIPVPVPVPATAVEVRSQPAVEVPPDGDGGSSG